MLDMKIIVNQIAIRAMPVPTEGRGVQTTIHEPLRS